MSGALISCVVPVYNAARHIRALADMLENQRGCGFEVIFVNDGSTDESGALLDGISGSGKFPMRVIHQPNGGASAARNAGVAAARGRYITFIDVDDGISDDYMDVMAKHANAGRELTVFRHSRVVDGDFRYDIMDAMDASATSEELLEEFLENPTRFGVYDFLIRRDVVEKNALLFPEGYPYYEDYHFSLRLFAAAGDIARAGECVYCYRASPGSAMSTFNDKRMECLELFEGDRGLYLESIPEFHARFQKWFAARLRWSVMWQACVSMDAREARDFGRRWNMRHYMKKLTDYPDGRVSLTARIYIMCPYIYIITMGMLGKHRTLIQRG
jgi:glycosyltransferase involved in cell wall biosynthesis